MSQPLDQLNHETLSHVAIGANDLADIRLLLERVKRALTEIETNDVMICETSKFYKTPCFPEGAGPDYVNAAVTLATTLSPTQLLAHLHKIEADFGRERIQRWGMRSLDLDLLSYGDQVLPDVATYESWQALEVEHQKLRAPDQLVLPHPRMQDRAFVLLPLADIAPDWKHPVLGQTVREMLEELPSSAKMGVVPL